MPRFANRGESLRWWMMLWTVHSLVLRACAPGRPPINPYNKFPTLSDFFFPQNLITCPQVEYTQPHFICLSPFSVLSQLFDRAITHTHTPKPSLPNAKNEWHPMTALPVKTYLHLNYIFRSMAQQVEYTSWLKNNQRNIFLFSRNPLSKRDKRKTAETMDRKEKKGKRKKTGKRRRERKKGVKRKRKKRALNLSTYSKERKKEPKKKKDQEVQVQVQVQIQTNSQHPRK